MHTHAVPPDRLVEIGSGYRRAKALLAPAHSCPGPTKANAMSEGLGAKAAYAMPMQRRRVTVDVLFDEPVSKRTNKPDRARVQRQWFRGDQALPGQDVRRTPYRDAARQPGLREARESVRRPERTDRSEGRRCDCAPRTRSGRRLADRGALARQGSGNMVPWMPEV